MLDTTIYFYLPYNKDGLHSIPDRIEEYWEWISTQQGIGEGKYSWTLQTYLHLKKSEIPCKITHEFPREGIVISHKDFLPVFLVPRTDVFLVCIKPDRKEHSCAHFYLVQNPRDKLFKKITHKKVAVIPFWPQPSLIPRDSQRANTCVNFAYLGRLLNLAPQLQNESWREKLRKLGCDWQIVPMTEWNDYSNIDVTVSVRNLDKSLKANQDPVFDPDSKPPTKLINSWLAGVPSIVGKESAYENIKEHDFDFIEVDTMEGLFGAVTRLSNDKNLYKQMQQHCLQRANEHSTDMVIHQWCEIISQRIQPAAVHWRNKSKIKRFACNFFSILKYLVNINNFSSVLTIGMREINKIFKGLGKYFF